MKKLFLASSFADVVDLFVEFAGGECEGKRVTFIPTASLPEEVTFYVAAGKEALETCGMIVDELEISTATMGEIADKLRRNDYIYVTGGNTYFLLQELRRTGADQILVEQVESGMPYVGESAGSVVLSPNIEYVGGLDDCTAAPELKSFESLALVDFFPLPHHTNFPFKEAVEKVISEYNGKILLCPISNSQAIRVEGNDYEVVGTIG